MYSDEEKSELMKELKEMESLKVDTGDEGKILQKDIICYFTGNEGNEDELSSRIELYVYAFKVFCRKPVKIHNNEFIIFLNDSILEYEKIDLLMKDLNKFDLIINDVEDDGEIFINLNFTFHF